MPEKEVSAILKKPAKKIVVKKVAESPVVKEVAPKKIGRPRKEKVLIPKDQKKSNPWVDHVKSYSAENHISYMNALKDPKCKSSYQSSKK